MSALAEALVAAQRRAMQAVEKAYEPDAPPLDPEYLALFYGVDAP